MSLGELSINKNIIWLINTIRLRINSFLTSSLFLVCNALKVSLFNILMITTATPKALAYKFIITFCIFTIIYLAIFQFRNRTIFLIFYILQTIYIISYFSYYLFTHRYPHLLQSFELISEGIEIAKNFIVPQNIKLLVVLFDLPVFILAFKRYKGVQRLFKKIRLKSIIIFLCILSLTAIEWKNYVHNYSIFKEYNNRYGGETFVVERYGTIINSIDGFLRSESESEMAKTFKYGKTISSNKAGNKKYNYVLIQVESMSANIVNQKHNEEYVMPFLKSLTEKSVYYPYTLSYHYAGLTSDCDFSALNSIEPLTNYPSIKLNGYNYPNSLVKTLEKQGYSTAAFHGNKGSFYNRDIAYIKMGFDYFYDLIEMDLEETVWGAEDKAVFDYVQDKISQEKQPFFYYVVTMSSHEPFTLLEDYEEERFDNVSSETVKNYYTSMSYVDKSLKDFITYIRSNTKNTYIIIYGDHCPGIDKGEYKQSSAAYDGKYLEYVPLLILTPDEKVYREDKKVASFLDIAPTVLFSSGTSFKYRADGINLLAGTKQDRQIPIAGKQYDRTTLYELINIKETSAASKK